MLASLERIASSYNHEIIHGWERIYHLKWEFTYTKLLSLTDPGRRIAALEMGCADGAMSTLLSRDFKKLSILDGSAEFLNATKESLKQKSRIDNVEFFQGLFEDFETEQKFDAIFLVHVLEHLEDPVSVLKKTSNWLSPGGTILINVPNAHSLHRQLGVKMGLLEKVTDLNAQDKKLGHKRVYTPALLSEHIQQSGLVADRIGGIMLKPLSNRQMNDWDEPMLKALFELGDDFPELSSELYAALRPRS